MLYIIMDGYICQLDMELCFVLSGISFRIDNHRSFHKPSNVNKNLNKLRCSLVPYYCIMCPNDVYFGMFIFQVPNCCIMYPDDASFVCLLQNRSRDRTRSASSTSFSTITTSSKDPSPTNQNPSYSASASLCSKSLTW